MLTTCFVFLFPHMEQDNKWRSIAAGNSWPGFNGPTRDTPKSYLNPADATCPADGRRPHADRQPVLGYAANAAALGCNGWTLTGLPAGVTQTFARGHRANLTTGFPDGTSGTVVFYERYAVITNGETVYGNSLMYPFDPANPFAPVLGQRSDWIRLTPQIGVPGSLADTRRSNGSHPGVVLVGLADGSTRGVTASISPDTWEVVQRPADGRVPGNDW